MTPMNWLVSLVLALQPLLLVPSNVVKEQSWNEASKKELKKYLPMAEAGERLLM